MNAVHLSPVILCHTSSSLLKPHPLIPQPPEQLPDNLNPLNQRSFVPHEPFPDNNSALINHPHDPLPRMRALGDDEFDELSLKVADVLSNLIQQSTLRFTWPSRTNEVECKCSIFQLEQATNNNESWENLMTYLLLLTIWPCPHLRQIHCSIDRAQVTDSELFRRERKN